MASTKGPNLSLTDETFGDRFHRAYRKGREKFGFTYGEVAGRVSAYYPVSDQTLIRLERELDTLDQATQRQRNIVFLTLIAYGFEPESFGIEVTTTSLDPDVAKVARRKLRPANKSSVRNQASHITPISRDRAGQPYDNGRSAA